MFPRRLGRASRDGAGATIIYFTPNDVLVPRVDRQCIIRFCDALAKRHTRVEVVSLDVRLDYDEPTRDRTIWDVYGVQPDFSVTILPCTARQTSTHEASLAIWRAIAYSLFALWALVTSRLRRRPNVVFYFKNYLLGIPFVFIRALFRGRPLLVFEIHVPPSGAVGRWLIARVDGLIPVSNILAEELERDFAVARRRILVAHQGVDLDFVEDRRLTKEEARRRVGLPTDERLVVYTGKVNASYSEIDLLTEAAEHLGENVTMVIVGGRSDQVQILRERAARDGRRNVSFVGFVAPADVFGYQVAADVLVMYYPSDIPLNRYRASPGKLFEYMASRRPIVTADLPALREVLTPDAAMFVEPDDPQLLAEGIRTVLDDQKLGDRLAETAYRDVQEFTWEKRAERVLAFVDSLGSGPRKAARK
jgi:glycosyltransferase involved in cell wall biosynthesis